MSRILFIVVNGLQVQHLGCYARKDRGTPNLDKVAQRGIAFQNAIAQAPITRASVASFMTGLYPSQHGLVDRIVGSKTEVATLDPTLPSLAELLAASGYATAAFLGGNPNLKPVFGLTRGFAHCVWQDTTDGAIITKDFDQWLQAERPAHAFCYLHFMDVHQQLPAVETRPSRLDRRLDRGRKKELARFYANAVRRVDLHIGRVMLALERAGIMEETLVIITADQGEELLAHGALRGHERTLRRDLVHVPLVMKMAGWAHAGRRINQPVQLIDIMPTILEYLGRPRADLPGRSLMPLIRGEETVIPAPAFSELSKSYRYIQSVTTPTHHFIRTYILARFASPGVLRPGLSVEIKGESNQGGPFLATKLSLTKDKRSKVDGPVEKVDTATGTVTTLGLTFQIARDTKFKSRDNDTFCLSDLAVGNRIHATLVAWDGRLVATEISRRKSGDKSRIVGVIERVQDLEGTLCYITVLGKDISIDHGVWTEPLREDSRSALLRVLAGKFIDTRRELYDITRDPDETHNIANEQPNVAQELDQLLAGWNQSLLSEAHVRNTSSVNADPQTLAQFRLMGYEASLPKYGVIWENKLTRSALPRDERGWQWLREQGVNTIVTFLDKNYVNYKKVGFKRFLRLPLTKKPPTLAEAETFLRFIQDPDNWPVHIHCYSGKVRAGTTAALARYAIDGWPIDKALAESGLGKKTENVRWLREWAANHDPGSHRLNK